MENLPLKFPLCISEKGVSSFKSLPKFLNSIHAGLYIEPVIIFYFSGVFQLQDWDILYTIGLMTRCHGYWESLGITYQGECRINSTWLSPFLPDGELANWMISRDITLFTGSDPSALECTTTSRPEILCRALRSKQLRRGGLCVVICRRR